jgi:hypothetical protein
VDTFDINEFSQTVKFELLIFLKIEALWRHQKWRHLNPPYFVLIISDSIRRK